LSCCVADSQLNRETAKQGQQKLGTWKIS